ncbi:MAG: UbiX family flavin prenyltransferase [Phycisphaerales bacterium]|nr:UbiX family flavin prenyltransferase [Phycisphaerales bacterium]
MRNGHHRLPPSPQPPPGRFVVGVSGASGALYAARLLEELLATGAEVHLVVTENGRRLLTEELGITALEPAALCPGLAARAEGAEGASGRLVVHPNKDVGAVIASGSFIHQGMVVVPCSSAALGYIATGSGSNLLARAAAVTLKERRRLVLVHRETPLSLIDIRNMESVTLAGGVVAPANPGFYLGPQSVNDLIDFVVGKCLDLLGVEHALKTRWEAKKV